MNAKTDKQITRLCELLAELDKNAHSFKVTIDGKSKYFFPNSIFYTGKGVTLKKMSNLEEHQPTLENYIHDISMSLNRIDQTLLNKTFIIEAFGRDNQFDILERRGPFIFSSNKKIINNLITWANDILSKEVLLSI